LFIPKVIIIMDIIEEEEWSANSAAPLIFYFKIHRRGPFTNHRNNNTKPLQINKV